LSWGPFRLYPRERLLEKNGMSVKVGSRALDILIALTSNPGEFLSNSQLIESLSRFALELQFAVRPDLSTRPGNAPVCF